MAHFNTRHILIFALAVLALMHTVAQPAVAFPFKKISLNSKSQDPKEPSVNVSEIPTQILKTGINLTSLDVSANSIQLSDNIALSPLLKRINSLEEQVNSDRTITLTNLARRQELCETKQKAMMLIQKTSLEVEFTLAEIVAETEVYNEILATFTNDRDKKVAKINALSFIANGILWAAAEALAIPGYKHSIYAIPSGVVGIPAGVVPSLASMWTLKAVNGKRMVSEVEPNMLAKIFQYPTTRTIEYPRSVWSYLNQSPADDPKGKKRLEQIVDRWIADANIPDFTGRRSKPQLDILTASASVKKGLSIDTLTARTVMLNQLYAEILKMKRMLLELSMVVQGEKQLTPERFDAPKKMVPEKIKGPL